MNSPTIQNVIQWMKEIVAADSTIIINGIDRGIMKFRRPLADPENDNRFEGEIRLHGNRSPMCRVFFDVIDLASIFDKKAPFNSTYWALPYRVKARLF